MALMAKDGAKWERRYGTRVARFLNVDEADIKFIALGTDGDHLNWFALLVGVPVKSRFLAIANESAYLIKPNAIMKPKKLAWNGHVFEVRVMERGARSSVVMVGERHLRVVNHFADKLERLLGKRDA